MVSLDLVSNLIFEVAMSEPLEEFEKLDVKHLMQAAATAVKTVMPNGVVFFIFAAPAGEVEHGRANYVSNMKREDAIKCMKEFIIRSGAAEDWMKNIP